MTEKNKGAFTLVELIVVITLLAILSMLSLIYIEGYGSDSRDSARITDMNHMKKSLELFSLATGKYPFPDNPKDISYSGTVLRKQGTFGEDVESQLSMQLSEKPTDPLYETDYVYAVLDTGLEYELMIIYESLSHNIPLFNHTYASASPSVQVEGTYNSFYIKSGDFLISTPSIITSLELTGSGVVLDSETIKSQVVSNGPNIPNIGVSQVSHLTGGLFFPQFVVYSGGLDETTGQTDLLKAYQAMSDTYSGSSVADVGVIKDVLSKTTDDEKVAFIKTVILNTTPYSCTGSLPQSNVDRQNTIGLTVNTPRQNVSSGSRCYYQCTGGYTGKNCDVPPPLITANDCQGAGWSWVPKDKDMFIGYSLRGNGFCISPRFGDWNTDSNTGNGGISWNGWGEAESAVYLGWKVSTVKDSSLTTQYGQTRTLDSKDSYACKQLGEATDDYVTTDNIVGRMKWLATTGNDYAEAQSIDWITGILPANGHAVPALFIADCIDGVKDLGTPMIYKRHDDNVEKEVTYEQYSSDATSQGDDELRDNRERYLIAWTQKSGSHLPSAMNGIESLTYNSNNAIVNPRHIGEYQIACEEGLFANDDKNDQEWIWLSALDKGDFWRSNARTIGLTGCAAQEYSAYTGRRGGQNSARFVVRP